MFFLLSLAASTAALQSFDTWSHERIQLQNTSIHFRISQSGKPPVVLVHGFPEDSHTWNTIGPILAEDFTVIAPDNRGSGQSALANDDDYSARAASADLEAVLSFLNINKTYVFGHDKGAGVAASLAFERPDLVRQLVTAEYPLPGSAGYSTCVTSPILYWDWQLAFFAVPDAATFFIQGREKEMLAWYFYHGSYIGNDAVSNDLLEYYTRTISKPGFLRAGMQYFAAAFEDADYFRRKINETKLTMPFLLLGGEASLGLKPVMNALASDMALNYTVDIIPKCGHWIVSSLITFKPPANISEGVENPVWVGNRVANYFKTAEAIPSVDLSWLDNTITMFGNDGLGGGMLTPGINRTSH